nr:hypothetical protein GCM10025699_32210 [Microbacterium flavescens]
MGGVDAISRKEVHDDGPCVAEAGLAEQLGSTEGQEAAHARCECAEGAHLGGEFGEDGGICGDSDDDAAAVVELGDGGVVAAAGALRQFADPHDADPGQSRRHGRG